MFSVLFSFVMWMKATKLLEKPQQNNLKRDFDYVKSFGVNCLLARPTRRKGEKSINALAPRVVQLSIMYGFIRNLFLHFWYLKFGKNSCTPNLYQNNLKSLST